MKERPILFSGPMVRAILAGRKTQTRRLVRNPARLDGLMLAGEEGEWSPYGRPGDRLWVKETFRYVLNDSSPHEPVPKRNPFIGGVYYKADPHSWLTNREELAGWRWRPSIFMPRWASRITLEVTEVRVQRLQEITPDDARAEGVVTEAKSTDWHGDQTQHLTHDVACAVEAFERLWDEINGKRAPWSSNPFVWAITFRRV